MLQVYSIIDVINATRMGRTKIYQLINNGKLKAKKVGKRTVILENDLRDFLEKLQNYSSQGEKK
jgi:excisionase family DNA binding protein